jgi:hypothetical protein
VGFSGTKTLHVSYKYSPTNVIVVTEQSGIWGNLEKESTLITTQAIPKMCKQLTI